MTVDVLIEININKKDKTFTYFVPDNLKKDISVGKRVLVPFNKQELEGFILKINKGTSEDLKSIIKVIDEDSILNEELLLLGKTICEDNLCNLVSIYQAMLPKGYKASKKSNVKEKYVNYLSIVDEEKALNFISTSKAKKQVLILEELLGGDKELKEFS